MNVFPLVAKDPMFSSGQIYFGIGFFIVFVVIISFMYLKDKNLHKKNYKGVFWVLIGFIFFILLLVAIKFGLQK
jgi:predicted cobalt transporter CbtA